MVQSNMRRANRWREALVCRNGQRGFPELATVVCREAKSCAVRLTFGRLWRSKSYVAKSGDKSVRARAPL